MRIVRHTFANGEIVQDKFEDATSAIIEPVNGEPVLVLRNKDGAVIASFDSARVIKCSHGADRADRDAMHTLLEDALKVIDVQRAHLAGIDAMRASQDIAARGFADIRERILSALK